MSAGVQVLVSDPRPRVTPAATRPAVTAGEARPPVVVRPSGAVAVTAPRPPAQVVVAAGRPTVQGAGPVRVVSAGSQGPAGIAGATGPTGPAAYEPAEETPAGVLDGVNAAFTLAQTPRPGSLALYRNGLLQRPGSAHDYTLAGPTVTFNAGLAVPQPGDSLLALYLY